MNEQLVLNGVNIQSKDIKTFYAVREGVTPGIYYTWEECSKNVIGYKGAIYKSFSTLEEAQNFIKKEESKPFVMDNKTLIVFTDGSFESGVPVYGFGCVFIDYKKNIYKLNGFGTNEQSISSRNIAGELLAVMFAIKTAYELGYERLCVYHDYLGVSEWALEKWSCNKFVSIEYKKFFDKYKENINIEFTHVKGHSGNKYNELADYLANEGRQGKVIREVIPRCCEN